MKEDEDQKSPVSTCLEGAACAEMMQKIMGEQGLGPLGEEMMKAMTAMCGKNKSKEEKTK